MSDTTVAFTTLGPPHATLNATYDDKLNRVDLFIAPASDTTHVSIWRSGPDGHLSPIPSLTYLPVTKAQTVYDYTAPLNQPAAYRAIFYRGEELVVDFIREATVTPRPDGRWFFSKYPVE